MEFIYDFIVLLPCGLSLLMSFVYLTRTRKSKAQKMMTIMAVLATIYFFADALYVSVNTSYLTYILGDLIAHFAAPSLILTAAIFLFYMHKPHRSLRLLNYLFIVAFSIGLTVLIPYCMIGFERAADFWHDFEVAGHFPEEYCGDSLFEAFFLLDTTIYYIICGIGTLALMIYIFHCMRADHFSPRTLYQFLFKGAESTPFRLECWIILTLLIAVCIRMGMGREACLEYPVISAIISIIFAELAYDATYIGLVSHMPDCTLTELYHPQLFTPASLPDSKGENNMTILSEDEEKLRQRLRRLMDEDHYYRDPMLTIEDVANQLGTNRIILTHIISTIKRVSFREYINEKRLADAKTYLLANPTATQEEVAKMCGFTDAASFNKKFRQAEGCTPRDWLIQSTSAGQRKK